MMDNNRVIIAIPPLVIDDNRVIIAIVGIPVFSIDTTTTTFGLLLISFIS